MSEKRYYGLDYDTFFEIVHNLHDEIWVYDNNYKVIYVNEAVRRHYALPPEDIIGKNFFQLLEDMLWETSILPHVYKEKKLYAIKQTTNYGFELENIAKPIFDENGNIKFVAMSVRDQIENEKFFNSYHIEFDDDGQNKPLVYHSKKMKKVMKLAEKISKIDSTCLITGETGTGKTMIAKYIHSVSDRKNKPFVAINCATIPEHLLESELFGYVKGAFTGALSNGKIGLLESANHGTVLLDEIAELPLLMQSKLLHVIQEKEFFPVGASSARKIDIKIIAATNKNLEMLIQTGGFRSDLYYRLNIFEINLPPLREREGDVEKLIIHFLLTACKRYEMHHEISKSALEILCNHTWRGNIRELSHTIERLVVTVEDIVIDQQHLPSQLFRIDFEPSSKKEQILENISFDEAVDNYKKELITAAYKKHKSTRKIAEALGITQTKSSTLVRKYINTDEDND